MYDGLSYRYDLSVGGMAELLAQNAGYTCAIELHELQLNGASAKMS